MDEAGYLRADLDEIARALGAPRECVDKVLTLLQGFDPVGVVRARSGRMSRAAAESAGPLDPAMAALLTRLDLVARRDIAALCAICGVDAEDIADMIAEIRALTPKPGLAFGSEPVQPVVPDVFVREGADGTLACRTQLRHAAALAGEFALLRQGVRPARATRMRRPISPIA